MAFCLRIKLLLFVVVVDSGRLILFVDVAESADDDVLDVVVVTIRWFMGGVLFLMADIFLFFCFLKKKNHYIEY